MWFYHLVQSRCAPPFVWEPLLRRNREVSVNTSAACHSRGANIIQELAQFSALETTMENLRVAESSAPPRSPHHYSEERVFATPSPLLKALLLLPLASFLPSLSTFGEIRSGMRCRFALPIGWAGGGGRAASKSGGGV